MLALFSVFYTHFISANEFNPKNYIYNDEGCPLFVKVYKNISNETSVEARAIDEKKHSLYNFIQKDNGRSFIAIPIKRNTDSGEDDYWECPYCETKNPASRNTCSNPDCPLYRKKGRDWQR